MYSFQQDPEIDWSVLGTVIEVEQAVRELRGVRYFAWDVETNGLGLFDEKTRIVGHAFAWRRSNGQIRSCYIPIRHKSYMGLFSEVTQLDPKIVTDLIKPILEGSSLKCGHNLSFDVHMARKDGIKVAPAVHDTLVGAKLINENLKSYKLPRCLEGDSSDPEKPIGSTLIRHQIGWKEMIKGDLTLQAKHLRMKLSDLTQQHGYEYVSPERLGLYANQDAVYEMRLAEYQFDRVRAWSSIWEMEMRLFWVCVDMSRIGVPIDADHLIRLEADQIAVMADLAPQIWELAGEEFEITNDNELRRIFFEKLGIANRGLTRKKAIRIDDDVLWTIEKDEPGASRLAALVREHNSAQTIVSTFSRGIVEQADDHGIVHCEIDQAGAKTGRVSARRPNLQNMPTRSELGRRVRQAFVARPGRVRFCLDYSQIELRVLAHLSQDPIMLNVYRNDLDIHSATAREVFGSDGKIGGIDMRRIAKILNFGIPFGITEYGVQRNINKDLPDGVAPFDDQRATAALNGFYGQYRGVDAFRRSLWYQSAQNGGTFWNMFGRPRRIPGICSTRGWERSSAERKVTSSMIQGSAADLVKFSMVACWDYLQSQNYCEADMVLMVHDDLQFDIAPDGSARVVREIKRLMEQTCQENLSVPIKADCEYFTTHWADKHKLNGI